MRICLSIICGFALIFSISTKAERDWRVFEKKIADKMKTKNLIYKEKEDKIRLQLSDRLKKLVSNENDKKAIETRIYRYIDRSGKSLFSDRVRHSGYKAVKLRMAPRRKVPELRRGSFFEQRKRYGKTVKRIAKIYRIPPNLLHAIVSAESGYDANAVSSAGAVGLMQLMPATATRYGVINRKDPVDSLKGGTRYFRYLLDMFNNDLRLALAAYNAGENAVIKYGRKIPPYKETRRYVKKVLKYYEEYSRNSGQFRK